MQQASPSRLRAHDPSGVRDSGAGDMPLERGPGMN